MVGDIVATGAAVGDGCVLWMVGELYRCIGKVKVLVSVEDAFHCGGGEDGALFVLGLII